MLAGFGDLQLWAHKKWEPRPAKQNMCTHLKEGNKVARHGGVGGCHVPARAASGKRRAYWNIAGRYSMGREVVFSGVHRVCTNGLHDTRSSMLVYKRTVPSWIGGIERDFGWLGY